MASAHVIALSHLVAVGLGLALVAAASRSVAHKQHARVRTEDAPQRRQHLRAIAQFIGYRLRGAARLAVTLGLALAAPIGLLCANQRYPMVAPVLAPFETRLGALGHHTGRACCVPLLVWHIWLVRCTGCHRRSVFREVPAPGGVGVELKVLGTSSWRTRRCPAEYLTAQALPAARSPHCVRPVGHRVRPVQRVPAAQPASTDSLVLPHPPVTDKTA